jgi:hypothetical protein
MAFIEVILAIGDRSSRRAGSAGPRQNQWSSGVASVLRPVVGARLRRLLSRAEGETTIPSSFSEQRAEMRCLTDRSLAVAAP